MIINNIPIDASLEEIIVELRIQLVNRNINLLGSVKETPDNIMVSCPFHKNGQERRPSAGIKKSDGTFHCFACGKVCSLSELITYCFGEDDVTGLFGWNWLLKTFAVVSIESRKSIELDFSRSKSKNTKDSISYISESELDSYREFHPYMWKRKLTPDVVELFDIGYDKNTRCLTFPVRDITGGTLFIARRSVIKKYFNYPNGVEKPVYGLYELYSQPKFASEVIICESMLDALSFWTVGKYAVALNGLGNDLQFTQLNNMPCRKFILCTDSDEAGMNARKRIGKNIRRKLLTEYILPDNKKDANDCTSDELIGMKEVFFAE